MATTVPILENNIHQTMDWIYAIEEACHWDDDNQRRAFVALRAVLHQLRDLLTIEEAAHLSAQLPLVIRGIFFENWNPNPTTSEMIEKAEFLGSIAKLLYPYQELDVEKTTRGVFQVLRGKLPPGEFDKIISTIPKEIRELYQ